MFVIFYIFVYLFIYSFIESWFLSASLMIAQSNVSIHTYETDLSIEFFTSLFFVMFKSYRLTLCPNPPQRLDTRRCHGSSLPRS